MKAKLIIGTLLCCCSLLAFGQNDSLPKSRPFGFGQTEQYFGEHSQALVNSSNRNEWILSAIKSMKSYSDLGQIILAKPKIIDIDDFKKISYRIQECRKIHFLNGDTVLICLHSVHQDPMIGDVSIAMDSQKNFYVNFGHICGSIIRFEQKSTSVPRDIKGFIENFVSDTDDMKWQKWQ